MSWEMVPKVILRHESLKSAFIRQEDYVRLFHEFDQIVLSDMNLAAGLVGWSAKLAANDTPEDLAGTDDTYLD